MTSRSDLPLYQAHVAAGGLFGDRRGQPVVASYGEPAAEYAAARSGAGLVDLALRGVLEASGPLRQKFLQGMLSNEVAGRRPGQGCRAALMSARGGLQALVRVLVDQSVVLLETDFDRVGPLQKTLEHHRVAAPVRFAASPGVVLALVGPQAPEVLRAAGAEPLPSAAEDHAPVALAGHAARLVKAGDLPGGGFVLHAPPEFAAAVWDSLRAAGARPVGFEALDMLRVETIRPWWGSDVTEDNLLHETGLVDECHSATKGCYVGQEVVARLSARGGNVNKALRGLRLEAPVAAGAAVTVDGKEAGRVTTAVVSPRLGPIALAYVHRNHFAAGTAVEAGGVAAIVLTGFEDEAAPAAGE
jgi:folate-binding protein YgfZ